MQLSSFVEGSGIRVLDRVPIPIEEGPETGTEFLTFSGLLDGKEHIAIGFGHWEEQVRPLVRVHSECLTGDVFGSLRCDCGPQLAQSRRLLAVEGGLLLYMRHEGRGIGLYRKLEAYRLQLEGLDTFEANLALGRQEDERDFVTAARMLEALGKKRVRLITNNPDKVKQLEGAGIVVEERVPTGTFLNSFNRAYLEAKRSKHLHSLQIERVRA